MQGVIDVLRGKRLFVVDDSRDAVESMAFLLDSFRVVSRVATDGPMAGKPTVSGPLTPASTITF